MDTTTLQIPMSKSLKSTATVVANEYGFSSLQELVRVLLTKVAHRQLSVRIEEPLALSARKASQYAKMIEEIETGRVKPFVAHSVKGLMNHLHGKDN